jgi:DNA excision repair protein ERCC-4
MTSSTRTCTLLTEFLSELDETAHEGARGRKMMMRKLRLYLWWKGQLNERKQGGKSHFSMPLDEDAGISEALKKKDKEKAARTQSRRRVRGGAPVAAGRDGTPKNEPKETNLNRIQDEAERFEQL